MRTFSFRGRADSIVGWNAMVYGWILERRDCSRSKKFKGVGVEIFADSCYKGKIQNSSLFYIVKLGLLVILYDIKINRYDLY